MWTEAHGALLLFHHPSRKWLATPTVHAPNIGCHAPWKNRNFLSDQQEILFLLDVRIKNTREELPCPSRALNLSPTEALSSKRLHSGLAPWETGLDGMGDRALCIPTWFSFSPRAATLPGGPQGLSFLISSSKRLN